jgi:hypothetical protein
MLKVVMARRRRLKKVGGDLEVHNQNVTSSYQTIVEENVPSSNQAIAEENVVSSDKIIT